MAMSAGPAEGSDAPMSDINTTPLVDVMLVLLIIFLITVPVVVQTVPVELPKVVFEPTTTKPENVSLSVRSVDGKCEVYWGQTLVTPQELLDRAVVKLKAEIDKQGGPTAPGIELPEAHIRGDVKTPYRCIGGAIFTMQRAGFARVGFISQPPAGTTSPRL
ncbi:MULTISPECIES: ExbD/TolR family protein [Sphingomonadales]|uniref:Biopolymer transporter ExbD n=2 Tax=Edaphosphingomonas TaxID=3423724 RepID=A0A2T4I5R6_9SPHN|nr:MULTISPECIES: biopolymer transporter ExbD [Sphingomonas]AGH50774.1 biopolymer transport protein ExbD/TolR [Sphingomonas sp. MM-1]MDX3884845.1 biopolymer transporter ExbD [Sphingomonas sp.]OHT19188.1 Biopolymer transport protein ExbD [Sphingomonas haloaromaticamans]PTD25662.1 biopolymer transporter ExbD [Sphingomonas fennica]